MRGDVSSDTNRAKWNERYRTSQGLPGDAAEVLTRNLHLLPASGTALDLACGLGANALLLAEKGFNTTAWDSAPVAIERLNSAADTIKVKVKAEVRDVIEEPPDPGKFDIIVVSRFLHRSLSGALVSALKPGGLLFYQTFVQGNLHGPKNPAYLLKPNELLQLFYGEQSELQVRFFEECGQCGDRALGLRDESMIVVQKN